jgi:hypothetical protein
MKSDDSADTKLSSGLPDAVADEEDLARFLTQSGHYNATMVRPTAFLPNPRNGKTSVFRHGAQPLEELMYIAQSEVGQDRRIHGAAIVKASAVRDVVLEATNLDVRAKEPPPRHADIVGWPWSEGDPELHKARQKEVAALLAQKSARPHLRFSI